jgi:hypothetical protein
MTKILSIEAEFEEPFADIIIGFAEMGYSKTLTAEVLMINKSYFFQLCRKHNVSHHFKPQGQQIDECRGVGKSRPGCLMVSHAGLTIPILKKPFYESLNDTPASGHFIEHHPLVSIQSFVDLDPGIKLYKLLASGQCCDQFHSDTPGLRTAHATSSPVRIAKTKKGSK